MLEQIISQIAQGKMTKDEALNLMHAGTLSASEASAFTMVLETNRWERFCSALGLDDLSKDWPDHYSTPD